MNRRFFGNNNRKKEKKDANNVASMVMQISTDSNKNKRGKNVTPMVRKFFTDSNNCNRHNYINFSVNNNNDAEVASVTLVVRDQPDELDLHRCPGSARNSLMLSEEKNSQEQIARPGWGASVLFNKNVLAILASLILVMVFIANASALGVTPARTTIDFEPNLQRSVTFSVINSEKKDVDIVIAVQGELKNNILVHGDKFSMSSSEESRQVSYDLTLPATMEPGLHTGEVVILQLPDEIGTSEAFIGAALAVVTQVYVYVPYPGKYAEAAMNIINANAGEDVVFIIPVISRGEFDLASVKANVDIYNSAGEKVDTFNTGEVSIPSSERREIVYRWKADVAVGTYRAVATLIYDGETKQLEGTFNVGNQELELQQIEVNDFSLGQIAKMEMLVENKWSEPVQEAYAQTNIYNDRGELMADFKSANYDIPALSKRVLISYWDTAGVKVGTYDTKVFLKYAGKSAQTDLQLKVEQNKIEVIGLGYVISEDSGQESNTLMIVLVIGIVTLIVINLLWFLLLRKRLKR